VDPAGTELERGLDGEVVLRGPNVMRGYLGHPEESATAIVDGWLHTGDVGHLDADGYLTLVGRSKDMIIRGGENIYPREIEEVLAGDPSVLEAAVNGVPDPNGERWSSPMSRLGPVTPSTSWHSKPGVPKPSAVNLG
jgi:long-chain acyl-CoA synthetase